MNLSAAVTTETGEAGWRPRPFRSVFSRRRRYLFMYQVSLR